LDSYFPRLRNIGWDISLLRLFKYRSLREPIPIRDVRRRVATKIDSLLHWCAFLPCPSKFQSHPSTRCPSNPLWPSVSTILLSFIFSPWVISFLPFVEASKFGFCSLPKNFISTRCPRKFATRFPLYHTGYVLSHI